MYTGLLHLHNLLRYVIVILLIIAVFKSLMGWLNKKEYTASDNKISLFLLISAHLQLVLGFVVYFNSQLVKSAMADMAAAMKIPGIRFFVADHMTSMILGIILITLGRIMGKKGKTDVAKFGRQTIFFTLAMIVIFYAIPWPWREIGIARPWF